MFDFKGKNVVITGGTRGIGKELVEEFARHGANVAFLYGASTEKAAEVEEEWKNQHVKVRGFQVDITEFEGVREVIKEVLEEFEGIDILINNAGITKDGYMMLMSADSWKKVIEVNLTGTFNVTKQLLTHFISRRSGKIINMTSVGGMIGMAGQTNYSASKAGIIAFTKSLSKEIAGKNINVNAIAPGYIQTEMLDTIPEKIKSKMVGDIPAGRIGGVKDIANVAMFLASDYANYINGQVLVVDGGLTA